MLLSKTEKPRLCLTADLRTADNGSGKADRKATGVFAGELKRFPPIDDVLAAVERTASRAFAA